MRGEKCGTKDQAFLITLHQFLHVEGRGGGDARLTRLVMSEKKDIRVRVRWDTVMLPIAVSPQPRCVTGSYVYRSCSEILQLSNGGLRFGILLNCRGTRYEENGEFPISAPGMSRMASLIQAKMIRKLRPLHNLLKGFTVRKGQL